MQEATGIDFNTFETDEEAQSACSRFGFDSYRKMDLLDACFEHFVQPKLIQPTFVVEYPVEISPFAKSCSPNLNLPGLTQRFEAFIGGEEIGNGFSELNDPIEQKARLESQLSQD